MPKSTRTFQLTTEGIRLAFQTLKRFWKNEYFQTAMMFALTVAIVFGFYFGAQAALGTEYPGLAVASKSMLPTLNVGDLIIVQKVDPAKINAQYVTGDIVVYRQSYTGKLIVHRAVKIEPYNDGYRITTRGDNNNIDDPPWQSSALVGKVIAKIPLAGNFPLFIHSQENMYFLIVIIILLIFVFAILPFGGGDEEENVEEKKLHERKKLFGKIDIGILYVLILNFLILCFLVFNFLGAFAFWQPGADPPQYVAVRGMYADLEYHESFSDVEQVYLSQGVMTYSIDCLVNGTIRPGVPTFSWVQASILILIAINLWTFINFMKSKEKPQTEGELKPI